MPLGTVNWDSVADDDVLNKGLYQFRLAGWKEKETSTGKQMISFRWVVEAPEAFVNKSLFENFVTGSDDNPDTFDPTSYGGRELKKTGKAMHIQFDPDVETTLNRMLECSLILAVEQETYQGRLQNKVTGRYALGDREPMVFGEMANAPTSHEPLAGRPTTRRTRAAKRA